MWSFAVGLYLVELTPNSLRLTAIYGLAVSFTMVLFGSTIGYFVDANPRLKGELIAMLQVFSHFCSTLKNHIFLGWE